MGIVVEDGTGLATANSYASENDFDNYVDDHGYVLTDENDTEAALIRGSQDLDSMFRRRYPGTRLKGRDQGLEWPRSNAVDTAGNTIASDEVPIEVVYATIELAIRERANPGGVLPDLERGGSIRSVRAGTVAVEFGANASPTTTWQLVNGIMSAIVGGGSTLFATASRG